MRTAGSSSSFFQAAYRLTVRICRDRCWKISRSTLTPSHTPSTSGSATWSCSSAPLHCAVAAPISCARTFSPAPAWRTICWDASGEHLTAKASAPRKCARKGVACHVCSRTGRSIWRTNCNSSTWTIWRAWSLEHPCDQARRLTILNVAGRGEPLSFEQCINLAHNKLVRVPGKIGMRLVLQFLWKTGVSAIPPEAVPYMSGTYIMNTERLKKFLGEDYEKVIRYPIADAFADSFKAPAPVKAVPQAAST